jgi:cell division initiation protein
MHPRGGTGLADDISPSQIRRQRFEMVRRGFDPQEVGAFLERVADRLAFAERAAEDAQSRLSSTSTELDDARATEEALQLTMVAATQAKDEMLARANAHAEEVRTAAQREAEGIVAEARRQASTMVDDSRRDAGGVVSSARGEHADLLAQVDQLRAVVSRVRQMLGAVAGTVDPALEEAEQILGDPIAAELPQSSPVTPTAQPVPVLFEAAPEAAVVDDGESEEEEEASDSAEVVLEAVAEIEDEPEIETDEPEIETEEPELEALEQGGEEVEPSGPPTLEIVSAADDEDTDEDEAGAAAADGSVGEIDQANEGDEDDIGAEAAEVERLLRQLRGG